MDTVKRRKQRTTLKPKIRQTDLGESVFGKVPPNSIELEQAILGAIIASPIYETITDKKGKVKNKIFTIDVVSNYLTVDTFYKKEHQYIYDAILSLHEQQQAIDLLTLTERCKELDILQKVGGAYYLVELTNKVVSNANIEYHARIVAQKAMQRELITFSTRIIQDCYAGDDVFEISDRLSKLGEEQKKRMVWVGKEMRDDLKALTKSNINEFPYEVLPQAVQVCINEYAEVNRLLPSHLATSALVAASSAIGRRYRVQYSNMNVSMALFVALVSHSGKGKTWALDNMFRPCDDWEIKEQAIYFEEHAEWKIKKEAHEEISKEPFEDPEPMHPQIQVDDYTIETLSDVLSSGNVSMYAIVDELGGLFKRMGKYSKSSDENSRYLSLFEGRKWLVNRKVGKKVIRDFHFGIAGGIQPDILHEMAEGGNKKNGLMFRFSFDLVEHKNRPDPVQRPVNTSMIEPYENAIARIFNFPSMYDESYKNQKQANKPVTIFFNAKANQFYFDWLIENNKIYNSAQTDAEMSIHVKTENMVIRLAGILELLHRACNKEYYEDVASFQMNVEVTIESVQRAIKVAQYYRHNALKVINRLSNPISALPAKEQALWKGLESKFIKSDAAKIGEASGIKGLGRSSVYNIITTWADAGLIRANSNGEFVKKY